MKINNVILYKSVTVTVLGFACSNYSAKNDYYMSFIFVCNLIISTKKCIRIKTNVKYYVALS